MNTRWMLASLRRGRVLLGLLLALVSVQVHAQAGPITTQTLFFDQAVNAKEGNYLAAQARHHLHGQRRASPGTRRAMSWR